MTPSSDLLREQLVRLLDWEDAHAGFDTAVDGVPLERQGAVAAGFEHTPWQLLEHMRIAQNDLLDFCLNPRYAHELAWPEDYWPRDPAPPGPTAWNESIASFKADREGFTQLVRDPRLDLLATVPTGRDQQTYLRAVLLAADHNAYHLGQLVAVRRALGIWR